MHAYISWDDERVKLVSLYFFSKFENMQYDEKAKLAWLYFFSKFENMVIMMKNLGIHIFLGKRGEKIRNLRKKDII